jgi:Protein of unknown function (DUF3617)
MTAFRALSTAMLLAMGVQPQLTWAQEGLPQGGSYEITVRLELPHLERWSVDKTSIICLPSIRRGDELPIPVVSANNPFERCTAANLTADSSKLEYDIVCPGRGAAKAHATYILSADTFSGRVAMVMGGKNMTMTEVQQAHRIGGCGPAVLGSTVRY